MVDLNCSVQVIYYDQLERCFLKSMNRLRIGAVSYLNTKPLVYGLESADERFDIIYDLPSRLADRLAERELDVALIPVIEAINNPIYTIVSDACIACRGPVRSVKLFSKVQAGRISTLALDEGSRTSATLSRIILMKQFGCTPECVPLAMTDSWREVDADAALVIGDRAMKSLTSDDLPFQIEIDLGEFWHRWTELPFVFAVWAALPGTDLNLLDHALSDARDSGRNNLDEICASASPEYGLSQSECRDYLTKHLHFQLGPREKLGLSQFFDYAKQLSLIDQDLSLQFYDCKITG